MNNCMFTGYLYDDPEVEIDEDSGAEYCEFTLYIYEYFRNKRGEKKRHSTYLRFIAWDSGARTIAKLGKEGMKMTINASAKNLEPESDTEVIFRVNQFDFGCLDKE
ncbi:MAG: single-stranded DNA-binding protein [SAR202 cluster bacterium]|nr:single-stranded DNA-binding protein [SAR202 cluster bacterium]|tara:strand:- start:22703 stop:23020 length:318 start_codon:yes stop_codon:yes gene_type:complete